MTRLALRVRCCRSSLGHLFAHPTWLITSGAPSFVATVTWHGRFESPMILEMPPTLCGIIRREYSILYGTVWYRIDELGSLKDRSA